ncbi:hypothetical protein SRHO_G00079200 [Serrasalmus rhombeus]
MHFVDNYSLDPKNADRFVKIRPVLDALKETFQSALDAEEFQSVDEMMIPYKGHLSIKQYVPKKPKPWGIKVWVRAGSSGYMYNFEPYQGPAGGRGSMKIHTRGRPSATPPRAKRRAVSKAPPEIRYTPGNHWPQLKEAKNASRCQDAACTRRTKYICMQCLVALCPGCFGNYHRK